MTTCKPCGAEWSGYRVEHCLACHSTFSGTTAGDMHRTGDHAVSSGPSRRRCRTADEMLAKGLEPTLNAYGTPIWGRQGSQNWSESLARLSSDRLTDTPEGGSPGKAVQAVTETVA